MRHCYWMIPNHNLVIENWTLDDKIVILHRVSLVVSRSQDRKFSWNVPGTNRHYLHRLDIFAGRLRFELLAMEIYMVLNVVEFLMSFETDFPLVAEIHNCFADRLYAFYTRPSRFFLHFLAVFSFYYLPTRRTIIGIFMQRVFGTVKISDCHI